MIIALIAALLIRLRCFLLLRRADAGRNGTRRAAVDMGATVDSAVGEKNQNHKDRISQNADVTTVFFCCSFLKSKSSQKRLVKDLISAISIISVRPHSAASYQQP